jgi:hypothetical protein
MEKSEKILELEQINEGELMSFLGVTSKDLGEDRTVYGLALEALRAAHANAELAHRKWLVSIKIEDLCTSLKMSIDTASIAYGRMKDWKDELLK